MTQAKDVLYWLHAYGCITTMEAFTELGITRLAARIPEIENGEADGKRYIIPRKRITVKARNGRKANVTQYQRPERV